MNFDSELSKFTKKKEKNEPNLRIRKKKKEKRSDENALKEEMRLRYESAFRREIRTPRLPEKIRITTERNECREARVLRFYEDSTKRAER